MHDTIVVKKQDLKELLAEYTANEYTVNSNLLGDIKSTLGMHTTDIAVIKQVVGEIKEQTLKTNGRVTSLELTRAENKGSSKTTSIIWSAGVSFAITVISAAVPWVIEHFKP